MSKEIDKEIDKVILKKYLKNQLSNDERKLVEDWYTSLGDGIEEVSDFSQSELMYLKNRIYTKIKKETQGSWYRRNRSQIAAAASFAILICISVIFLYPRFGTELLTKTTSEGIRSKILLADGSIMILNENSSATYPNKFEGETREINLTGEAFFEIAKDKTKPFIVHADEVQVKVLGTSFNVNARNQADSITITVMEGKVAVLNENTQNTEKPIDKLALLVEDERLVYNKKQRNFKKVVTASNTEGEWHKNQLLFRNMLFSEIAIALEEWYNVEIEFENSIMENCVYTANIESSRTLMEALDLLSSAQQFSYEIDGNIVKINGQTCN